MQTSSDIISKLTLANMKIKVNLIHFGFRTAANIITVNTNVSIFFFVTTRKLDGSFTATKAHRR